jgi:hypothetical protein
MPDSAPETALPECGKLGNSACGPQVLVPGQSIPQKICRDLKTSIAIVQKCVLTRLRTL